MILKKIYQITFILSIPFTTLLLCGNYNLEKLTILTLLSTLVGIFLITKIFKKLSLKNLNKKYLIFSILFSLCSIKILSKYSNTGTKCLNIFFKKYLNITIDLELTKNIICICSALSVISLIYYLIKRIIPFIKTEYKKFTKEEKVFLIILSTLGLILTTFLYSKTNAFYFPIFEKQVFIPYDIIYTTDSGGLNKVDAYTNIGAFENDLRQPLFGLFALPFSLTANFISKILYFIPNSYYTIFNTIQIILLGITLILIEKMLKLTKEQKIIFLTLMISTFPVILFSFVQEQYIISLFYLIATIYIGYFNKKEVNYCYVASVGTLLTSGIIFPFITKFNKKWFKNILKCFICFLVFAIISGQILMLPTVIEDFNSLMRFSGEDMLLIDRLNQFLYFVRSIFIAPSGQITGKIIKYYRLIKISSTSLTGIIILLTCILSFILNKKNKFAKISFLWIIFSLIILCLIGWGTKENGLILYSLYFSWAYVSLIYLLINKLIKNTKLKNTIFIILILIMLYYNTYEFTKIILFCLKYYYT